jgi:uncharacterized repeat protein (TIGR03803 family)
MRTLYSFKNQPDGATPDSLTAIDGTLYGAAANGGTQADGTVFELRP